MSEDKKYFYLKLKETFFDLEEMKILESQKNGIEYQNLYLKLCLLSLKSGGALLFKDTIPYDCNMLSTVLRVNIDTVKTGIEMFSKLGLIEILDSGIIYMADIQTLIGKSSTEGERKKMYRERIKMIAGNSGQTSGQTSGHRPPELELEKELEIETEKNKQADAIASECKKIIDYLNQESGKHFRYTQANFKHIKARLKDGFTFDDFRLVIDYKVNTWGRDPKMSEYVRPETLFGTKMESYREEIR